LRSEFRQAVKIFGSSIGVAATGSLLVAMAVAEGPNWTVTITFNEYGEAYLELVLLFVSLWIQIAAVMQESINLGEKIRSEEDGS